MVIMDTSDYDRSILNTLSNTNIYSPLPSDLTSSIQVNINQHLSVMHDNNVLSDQLFNCTVNNVPSCPYFYGLPKIHKPIPDGDVLPPFRGIISSINGPTTRASYFLDHILNPLVPLYCGNQWCKDSLNILQDIDTLNSNHVFNDSFSLLTIDVVDMYNSIPHTDGIAACRDALSLHSDFSASQIEDISFLIQLVLENNCFHFKNSFFQQIRGTAMGSPFAPAYANIFMAFLWKNSIAPALSSEPFWLKRYMDDFVAILSPPFDHTEFLEILNSCHPTVKFTSSSLLPSVAFLDINIHFSDGSIHTDLYSKPTDSHKYLSPKSSHPKHIFRSIVYSGALRLRRICSKDSYFSHRLALFSEHLVASGYSKKFILDIFSKVSLLNRLDLLKPSRTRHTTDRISFVTTFHPRMHNISACHSKHEPILKASSLMSSIMPSKPLVAHRRSPNLGNLLVNLKPTPRLHSSPGFFPCGNKRCLICKTHAIHGPTVTSTVSGAKFKIKQHITCNSASVIYVLSCARCGCQYTGQTKTPLRTRFNNEKSAIRNLDRSRPYGAHFNLPDHKGLEDVRLLGIELVSNDLNILERESFWLWNLNSHRISGGMNLAEDFLTSLTLTN